MNAKFDLTLVNNYVEEFAAGQRLKEQVLWLRILWH